MQNNNALRYASESCRRSALRLRKLAARFIEDAAREAGKGNMTGARWYVEQALAERRGANDFDRIARQAEAKLQALAGKEAA